MKTESRPFWDPDFLGKPVVYVLYNTSNWKVYVGQTHRLLSHYRGSGKLLSEGTVGFVRSSLVGEVISVVEDRKEREALEKFYIDYFKSWAPNGYNLPVGGMRMLFGLGRGNPLIRDHVGDSFGDLTVTDIDARSRYEVRWVCRCSCGNVVSVRGEGLRKGLVTSCGHPGSSSPNNPRFLVIQRG